jgi:hypothetical protein
MPSTIFGARGFHPWEVKKGNLTLSLKNSRGREIYYIDLERCLTSAQVLDWIMQVAGKRWATSAVLAGLVRALAFVLHPQQNLCSWGRPKSLTREQIKMLVHDWDTPYTVPTGEEYHGMMRVEEKKRRRAERGGRKQMANDRIFLRCTRCLKHRLIYKHYPGPGGYATAGRPLPDSGETLDQFITEHMDSCHPHRHGPDLYGFPLFDCVTECCWRMTPDNAKTP